MRPRCRSPLGGASLPAVSRRGLVGATLAVLAWGAFAFGANYPWAYTPLIVATAVIGAAGVVKPAPDARWPAGVLAGLGTIAAAALLQLIPLPQGVLETISPATARFLAEYDIAYAYAASLGQASHSVSIVPRRTWLALALLVSLTFLLVGTSRMLTRATLRPLAAGITVLGVLLSVDGVVQQALWNGKIYGFWQPQMAGNPFGPFVNKNHFATWMVMALPVALGLFAAQVSRGMRGVRPDWRHRLIWLSSTDVNQTLLVGFSLIVMSLGLVMTFSRSGMLAFLLALTLAVAAVLRRRASSLQRGIVAGYFLLLPLIIGIWVGFDAIVDRFAVAEPQSIAGRAPIWRDTLAIVRDFPLFGTGLNTYGYATVIYNRSVPEFHLREAHSDYLQLAAEGGLLLCLPVIGTVVLLVREIRRRFAAADPHGTGYWVRVGAVTGLVAVAAQSVVEFGLQMPGNAVMFAVLVGMALHQTPPGELPSGSRPDASSAGGGA